MTLAHSDLFPLIKACKPFKAGNVFAEYRNGQYVTYSYGEHFPLAVRTDEGWRINHTKFSPSTTRQQQRLGLSRLPGSKGLPTHELCALVDIGSKEIQRERLIARVTRRIKS